jgi:hypothetical protein
MGMVALGLAGKSRNRFQLVPTKIPCSRITP